MTWTVSFNPVNFNHCSPAQLEHTNVVEIHPFSPGRNALHMWDPHLYYMRYSFIQAVAQELTSKFVCWNKKKNIQVPH